MKLAILFWFYKEPDICLNRLELIRKHNPDIKIFGLFGGRQAEAREYEKRLGPYLDDFFVSTWHDRQPDWKWINGDLLILDWYKNRGEKLKSWDSVAVVQWDALVLGNIKKQFSGICRGEIFISGVRRLDRDIEKRWHWTKPGGKARQNYLAFRKYLADNYQYRRKPLCSLFIFQIFPRSFFKNWLTVKDREIGMLEYKIPTYAKIFQIPFYKANLGIWWFSKRASQGRTALNARGIEIQPEYIRKQLKRKTGFRIFHPYFKKWGS